MTAMADAAPEDGLRRLAALWRAVVSRPPHPAGCTCMGHLLVPAMGAREMEADILDHMRARYAAEEFADLVALLDARAAEREAEDIPARPMRAWLVALSGRDAASLPRFVDDLTATLESFGLDVPQGASGSGLFCV